MLKLAISLTNQINFKSQLESQRSLLGTIVSLPCASVAEILSQLGFDWLWLDMEHSTLNLELVQQIIQAVGSNAACLVRAPGNDVVWLKRILDTGCDGVIVPQIQTPQEALQAVRACKYPPEGIRSVGLSRAHNYGIDFQEYVATANQKLVVALQIEHINAVDNIDEIAAVAGFDAIIIGPYDLSASMGKIGQVDCPEVQQAIARVRQTCVKQNIPLGIFAKDSRAALLAQNQGYRLICVGLDFNYLLTGAQQTLQQLKSS